MNTETSGASRKGTASGSNSTGYTGRGKQMVSDCHSGTDAYEGIFEDCLSKPCR